MKLREDARVLVAEIDGAEAALLVFVDDEDEEWGYSSDDWEYDDGPSFGFDGDALRRHDGAQFVGPAIPWREGTAEDLAAWPDVAGVFVRAE